MSISVDLSRATATDARVYDYVVSSLPDDFSVSIPSTGIAGSAPDTGAPGTTDPTSDPVPGGITLVSGGGPGTWASSIEDAPTTNGSGILIVDPTPVDARDVDAAADMADARNMRVSVAERFAGNPALSAVTSELIPAAPLAVTARVLSSGEEPLRTLALEMLRVLGTLGIRPALSNAIEVSASAMVAGSWRGAGVSLVAARAPRTELVVHVTGADRELSIRLFAADTARPAEICSVTSGGGVLLPGLYESAYRVALRMLPDAVPGGDALRGLSDDIRALETVWL